MEHTNEAHVGTRQYNKNARTYTRERWESEARDANSIGVVRQLEAGSIFQTIGGAGALVLGILGIVGVVVPTFDAIASIAAGGALLIGGTALAARYSRLFPDTKSPKTKRSMVRGMTYQALVGVGAIALGILALLGLASITLVGASVIALGTALLVAGRASVRLDTLLTRDEMESGESVSHSTAFIVSAIKAIAGLGAVTLGVLALAGVSPLALTLIAMIAIGAGALTGGIWLVGVSFSAVRVQPAEVEE